MKIYNFSQCAQPQTLTYHLDFHLNSIRSLTRFEKHQKGGPKTIFRQFIRQLSTQSGSGFEVKWGLPRKARLVIINDLTFQQIPNIDFLTSNLALLRTGQIVYNPSDVS